MLFKAIIASLQTFISSLYNKSSTAKSIEASDKAPKINLFFSDFSIGIESSPISPSAGLEEISCFANLTTTLKTSSPGKLYFLAFSKMVSFSVSCISPSISPSNPIDAKITFTGFTSG
ncbi:MAG: hypothetical protein KJ711_03515, partial [Candidatus Omnitrophica bacterium]|nr:hypothetical protein [Candidatus Omnitrophota bacterium]MBU1523462.1 hypothetical protein [Candidatus Omnitrophota bacterium]